MPKPFSRPSISLSGDVRRQWRYTPIEQVSEGDSIAEFGELAEKFWEGVDLIVTSTVGRVERLPAGTMVHAYVSVPQDS